MKQNKNPKYQKFIQKKKETASSKAFHKIPSNQPPTPPNVQENTTPVQQSAQEIVSEAIH